MAKKEQEVVRLIGESEEEEWDEDTDSENDVGILDSRIVELHMPKTLKGDG